MSVPLGVPVPVNPSIITSTTVLNLGKSSVLPSSRPPSHRRHLTSVSSLTRPGLCRASQIAELFPTVSPEIVVREARLEDCWEVAETHCSSFFPGYSFPLAFLLRVNRLVGMFSGFSLPNGRHRVCLVAVTGSSANEMFLFGSEDFRIGGLDGRFSLNRGNVAGILTLDTLADFLPRKGPLRQRRAGIAYISNVAVREGFRRKGIAKRLVSKAEAQARSWGCRAVALHCDVNNPGATKLYKGRGFKCVKVPEGANWPQPRTSPDIKFSFMMKLLSELLAAADDASQKEMEDAKEQARDEGENAQETMPSSRDEEAAVKKKYGGIMPKKPPLISKDHERAYFDSADWALGKQGVEKPKGPLEALRPKLQPTQQQTRYRKSPYAPSNGEDGGSAGAEEAPMDE
ncbi:hypothetical protein MLD38_002571 [Melastoma candidum]|uniref:Uncharacterized protein n=1 Tax=Melastoma candidum TaxID=119954 RepID=A0ACB9S119_9MYRT|nr:hypothetical protein MLD38_002571 [Melastoma candidum]